MGSIVCIPALVAGVGLDTNSALVQKRLLPNTRNASQGPCLIVLIFTLKPQERIMKN